MPKLASRCWFAADGTTFDKIGAPASAVYATRVVAGGSFPYMQYFAVYDCGRQIMPMHDCSCSVPGIIVAGGSSPQLMKGEGGGGRGIARAEEAHRRGGAANCAGKVTTRTCVAGPRDTAQ